MRIETRGCCCEDCSPGGLNGSWPECTPVDVLGRSPLLLSKAFGVFMFVLTFKPLILCYSFFLPDVSLLVEPCKVFLNSSPLLLLKAIKE